MPNILTIKKGFSKTFYVEATLKEGEDLPPEIFIYQKTDSGDLGDYVGIASIGELSKIPKWKKGGSNFGSRYCRHSVGRIVCKTEKEQEDVIVHLKNTFKMLVEQAAASIEEIEEYVI